MPFWLHLPSEVLQNGSTETIDMILTTNRINKAAAFFESEKGSRWIPYSTGNALIRWFCHTDFARREYFNKRELILREFARQTGLSHIEDVFPDAFVVNFQKGWRAAKLSYLSDKDFFRRVEVIGKQHLDNALSNGKGVVLVNSHFGFAEIALTLFSRLNYPLFATVVREKGANSIKVKGIKKSFEPVLLQFKDQSNEELIRMLFKARQTLQAGGIVHLLGDGYHGKSSISMSFLGKVRGFRPSFAELALSTGAAVVPMIARINTRGNVSVDLYPPLDQGDETMSHEEKIMHLLTQYLTLLSGCWKKEPQLINWGFVEKFIRQVSDADQMPDDE
jgi:KDO2-lipid IV(A) lauroyltransferase